MKFLLISLIFVVAALQSIAQPKIGEAAYEISLPDVTGKVQKLSGQSGKIVLVDFWASWCGPCRRANPDLALIYSKYKNKGFEIFGVSIDDSRKAWKKAIVVDHITWKQVNASEGWDAPVALQWKLEQIPASFLVDAKGKLIAIDPLPSDIEKILQTTLK